MKVGILTYTREYKNLGTNMQCYCTFKAVREAYPDAQVELIDYARTSPSRRPYLSHVSIESLKSDFIRTRKYDRFFRDHLIFSQSSLTTTSRGRALDFIRRQDYDAIYVGSDTVLEMKDAPPDGLTPYWLDGTVGRARILLSASAHNVSVETLSPRQRELMQTVVSSFAILGVRDEATHRLLSHFVEAGDTRLRRVPDPTFIYEIDYSHVRKYLKKRHLDLNRPMVCLHLLRDSTWAERLAKMLRDAGYLVASLRPADYADIVFTDLSPFEQLGLYKYFRVVITHRFHDTIFCLKNLTPVISFPEHVTDVTLHGESKIATLLKAFGALETNFVPSKALLTAERLFEQIEPAISYFAANSELITRRLDGYRDAYRDFVQKSRLVLQ